MSQEYTQSFGEESQVFSNSQKRSHVSDTEEDSWVAPSSSRSFKKLKSG